MDELRPESIAYLDGTPFKKRKALGQFFTPRTLRRRLIERIPFERGMKVLDPACGSGEFLADLEDLDLGLCTTGWDVEPRLLGVARTNAPKSKVLCVNALEMCFSDNSYDVVISNPPYFQTKARTDYSDVISGRANIFAMFFKVGMKALKPGGYLAFVVPPSMNNGAYFAALRQYILDHSAIRYLKIIEGCRTFEGVNQTVQLIVLQKDRKAEDYHFTKMIGPNALRTIFSEDVGALKEAFQGRTALYVMGYKAITGTCVWNKHRDDLSDSEGDHLIWAHNITEQGLDLSIRKEGKPSFVLDMEPLYGPAIVVNRVIGSVGFGRLKVGSVSARTPFVAENHVNVIVPQSGCIHPVGWRSLVDKLLAPGVSERARLVTGNTQLSATELTHLLPLDL